MTRFGIDAATAIRISRDEVAIHPSHKLVAPNRLMSDALASLYEAVRRGDCDRNEGRRILDGVTTMQIRLLGDRVSRGTAWRIAEERGWSDTGAAEYLAVAKLQADALIALDDELVKRAAGVVQVVSFDALTVSD